MQRLTSILLKIKTLRQDVAKTEVKNEEKYFHSEIRGC